MRHIDVPLKWHDLARRIAGHCGNEVRASVKLATVVTVNMQSNQVRLYLTAFATRYVSLRAPRF